MTDRRRNGLILLLVAGLIAASAVVILTKKTRLGLDLKGGVELVYQARPTPAQPKITQDAIDRSIDIMRERVDQLGVAEPEIQRSGRDQIAVGLPDVKNAERAQKQVGKVAQLYFYDWEKSVLGPDLKPHPADANVTGGPQAGIVGGLSLYDAVKRASKRPPIHDGNNTTNAQYYLFGPAPKHRLIAGPEDTQSDLFTELPGQRQPPNTEIVKVNTGTVVVKADTSSAPKGSPDTYFVLDDSPALSGTDIKDPKQNFDNGPGGNNSPIVTFDFTGSGRKKWEKVTREIAQRGLAQQVPGQSPSASFQHFAAVLDNGIVTAPYISYIDNPDGIDGRQGSQIEGNFKITEAQDLANQLKLGALPVRLKLISQSQVSATLGKQALHQGLIAGAVGFAIVALFLLIFYRVLGVIAVMALGIYAIYLFALVKLIPITMTLPGIAGLVLTIGVAADANIVIFERVKEEIRGGSSIPRGIAAGYKKGLSAIIDANVVTLMTAFILFILATAGVKGFAFTLGIGTIVSLFTAVLATSAILGTMGRSRFVARPSLLGAGGGVRRSFHFDYMGASKWFFSMSGVILLIGALAIGGKGLNFGIDFESGTRIQVGLEQKANEDDVRSVMSAAGYADAKIQRYNNKELGSNAFQISTPTLAPTKVAQVRNDLNKKFGIATNNFSSESIGPSFGQTVANSALMAIIASLLVISIYIALRFEWKYAVPVLIALMHDILITGGVYALTGREVTTSTVAALLTILGYSLYDTIIVFDRIRENVPRMPRAAFSQIVNRSMSEVIVRSLATSFCTVLPVLALLLFGGETLRDFAFALLVGIASGTYSSIFIASPVLTHWKEREKVYVQRSDRIRRESGGLVPAYAVATVAGEPVDVVPDPTSRRRRRRGRITAPEEPTEISRDEFDDLVADLDVDDPRAVAPVAPAPRRRSSSTSTGGGRSGSSPKADGEAKKDKPKRPRNRRHGRNR